MGPTEGSCELKRHRVDFADAATVLDEERAITVRDDEGDEERYVTIGMDALGNVRVVVYTGRGERPRLISARKATPQEREQYGGKAMKAQYDFASGKRGPRRHQARAA